MIKLTEEISDKSTFLEFVNIEKEHIFSLIHNQEELNKKLVNYLNSFSSTIIHNSFEDENLKKINDLEDIAKLLKLSNSNIKALKELVENLDSISKQKCLDLAKEFKKIENCLEEYNKFFTNTLLDISVNNNLIKFFINKRYKEENIVQENKNISDKTLNIHYPENTLLISEEDKKVFLPYEKKEIFSILENPNFSFKNEQEIIEKLYTVPSSNYKSFSLSRFKEAYKLVREKEKGSIAKALDLGLELFSNYNLHPAIITACKNMHELDIYLSCLEYNELEDFKYFKTEFKSPPLNTKINL